MPVRSQRATEKAAVLPAEERLVQSARSYADEQKRKSIKWFVSKGPPVSSAEENERVAQARQEEVEAARADQREADRVRTDVKYETSPVTIPSTAHPLHNQAADVSSAISYSAAAANGLEGRKVLFDVFEQLTRILILRNRLDARLQVLNRKDKTKSGTEDLDAVPQLPLFDMSVMPTSVSTTEFRLSAGGVESVTPATVNLFSQKELAVPFEFKNNSLRPVKFADHPFQNADLPEVIDVFPAGVLEAPQSQATAPSVEHFVQPVITLETFPFPPFAFDCAAPFDISIRSTAPQRVTDGGFKPVAFGTTSRRVRLFQRNDTQWHHSIAPSLPKLMVERPADHDMSDSDDDDELPTSHPSGLDEVGSWLKGLSTSATQPKARDVTTTNTADPSQSKRREACNTFVQSMLRDVPSLQLQF